MDNTFKINPENGHVNFLNLEISPQFKKADLPDTFTKTPFEANGIRGFFAETKVTVKNILYEVSLRFNADKLVSVSLTLTPPQHMNLSSDEFYTTDRYGYQAKWLRKQLAPHKDALWGNGYEFAWGIAGAGEDKSANVFIYLNYEETDFRISKQTAERDKLRGCPQ